MPTATRQEISKENPFVAFLKDTQEKYDKTFKWGKVYLWLIMFQTVVAVGIHAYLIADPFTTRNQSVAMVLVFVNVIFFLYFAFDGILNGNMFEVGACLFMSMMLLAFSIYEFINSPPSGPDWSRITFLTHTVVVQGVYAWLSWKLYLNIGWKQFQEISVNPKIRAMYRIFQSFETMVKVDIVYACLLIIIAGFFLLALDDYELYLNMVALVFQCVWGWGGRKAVMEENQKWIYIFWGYGTIEPLYIIGKFVTFYLLQPEKYVTAPRGLFLVLGLVALGVRTVIYVLSAKALENFNGGLKAQVFDRPKEERGSKKKSSGSSRRGASARGGRSSRA